MEKTSQWILQQDFFDPTYYAAAVIEELSCMRCTGRGRQIKPRASLLRLPREVILQNFDIDSTASSRRDTEEDESSHSDRPVPKGRAQVLRDRMARISSRRPSGLSSLSSGVPNLDQRSEVSDCDAGSVTSHSTHSAASHIGRNTRGVGFPKRPPSSSQVSFRSVQSEQRFSSSLNQQDSDGSHERTNAKSLPTARKQTMFRFDNRQTGKGSVSSSVSNASNCSQYGQSSIDRDGALLNQQDLRSSRSNHAAYDVETSDGQFDNAADLADDDEERLRSTSEDESHDTSSTASMSCGIHGDKQHDKCQTVIENSYSSGLECVKLDKMPTNLSLKSKPSTLFEKAYMGGTGQAVVFQHLVKFGGGQPKFKGFSMAHKKTPEHFTTHDFPTLPADAQQKSISEKQPDSPKIEATMKDLGGFLLSDGIPAAREPSVVCNGHTDRRLASDLILGEDVGEDGSQVPTLYIKNMPGELTNEDETSFLEILQFYGQIRSFALSRESDNTTTARIKLDSVEAANLACECFHLNDSCFYGHTIEAVIVMSSDDES